MEKYRYDTIYPKPNSYAAWEIGLPIGHRMVLRKRRNTMIPTGYPGRVTYQIRCTCKALVEPTFLRPPMTKLVRIYMNQHISEVRKQGELWDINGDPNTGT